MYARLGFAWTSRRRIRDTNAGRMSFGEILREKSSAAMSNWQIADTAVVVEWPDAVPDIQSFKCWLSQSAGQRYRGDVLAAQRDLSSSNIVVGWRNRSGQWWRPTRRAITSRRRIETIGRGSLSRSIRK